MEAEPVNFEDCRNWQAAAACRAAGPPRRRDATAPAVMRAAGDPENAGRLLSRASPVILVPGRLRCAGPRDRAGLAIGFHISADGGCDTRVAGQIQAGMTDAA